MRQTQMKFFGPNVETILVGADVRGVEFSHVPEYSFAVTHVTQTTAPRELYHPIPRERSFLLEVHLQASESAAWGTWIGGVFHRAPAYQLGAVGCFDLEDEPQFKRNTCFDSLFLNIPKTTLEAYLQASQLLSVRSFRVPKGDGDPVMLHLARLMACYVDSQISPSTAFIEHYVQMVCGHLVSEYAALDEAPRLAKGGLAPWQKRRALEILDVDLGGDLRLARLAAECELSLSYFCRCFRTTFGCSLHQFVVQKRVARAQQLLLDRELSIAEIAIETGFSDQAAFSRTFGSAIGKPPGKWRAEQRFLNRISKRDDQPLRRENTTECDSQRYMRPKETASRRNRPSQQECSGIFDRPPLTGGRLESGRMAAQQLQG